LALPPAGLYMPLRGRKSEIFTFTLKNKQPLRGRELNMPLRGGNLHIARGLYYSSYKSPRILV